MEPAPDSLHAIPAPLRESIGRYAARLRQLWGHRLFALTVYGDALNHAFDAHQSVIHTTIVIDAIHLEPLRELAHDGFHWGAKRIVAPLVFTPTTLLRSCDTFPLELIEIQQRNVTVLGRDYFTSLEFADADVRLQCERELKVIGLGIHQGLLAACGQEDRLHPRNRETRLQLLRALRGLLWLNGQRRPLDEAQLVVESETIVGHSLPGIGRLWESTADTPWERLRLLYADVQTLGQYVDAM